MKIAKEKETVSPLAEHHQATAREKFRIVSIFLGQGAGVYHRFPMPDVLLHGFCFDGSGGVSIILAIGKVWDAVNDTLFGLIVDAVKFKS